MRLNTNAHAHVIRERRKKKVKKIKSCFNSFLLEQSKKEGIFFLKTSVLFASILSC